MTAAVADPPLAAAVRRTTRGQRIGALLLVSPLFVLLLLSFCLPIAMLLAFMAAAAFIAGIVGQQLADHGLIHMI